MAHTQPKISIIPITKQIFIAARQPPKWLANTPIVALEKNIGIKPGMIMMEEPTASRTPTAISCPMVPHIKPHTTAFGAKL
ncbi:hypothetical protein D3C85_1798670 [compost metagenome]